MRERFRLYRPGGRAFSRYESGKLVERYYIDLVPADIASPDLETFLDMLRDVRAETDSETFQKCRVVRVDENGNDKHYDALEFLENAGNMTQRSLLDPSLGLALMAAAQDRDTGHLRTARYNCR